MNRSAAEIVREYGPFPDVTNVGGVTYDGHQVWIAVGDKLNAFDPASGKILRSIDVPAHAGTAFAGQHLYQIADGRVQKPPGVGVSGLECDGGDQFCCCGGGSGKVRVVRRPKRRTAVVSASPTK